MTTEPATIETTPAQPPEGTDVAQLVNDFSRIVTTIGDSANPRRSGGETYLSDIGLDFFSGVPLRDLSALFTNPYSQAVVDAKCNHCDTVLQCRRIVAPFVACDDCIKKAKDAVAFERNRHHWERVCPERYRKTDVHYAGTKKLRAEDDDFPLAIWNSIKAEYAKDPRQSFFFFGQSGRSKTRTAMLLLYRAMVRRDIHVDVIWPEELSKLTQKSFDNAETYFDRMAKVGLLLLDDALLTACREPKLMEALRQLVDVRMRHERPFIVTSQIGTEEDLAQGKEYGDAKQADLERIRALLRRLREVCRVVSFAKVETQQNEGAF